ncbi:GntR family transcriptional regulator [Streptomyces aidingensis]|uniref:GntR family transcriptional regulator n=1 Tax=Streptomyces aidingensis TaxID=910347 RepID=A0A1I1HGF8_9ACTN|nr:GntR family transcriptional regulator [Streptomyces aidingensis]SFC23097.1 GntR family transcriptional regulator [Streptomyces aidingensis]
MVRGYRELADELEQRINAGEFRQGGTLPRISELEERYGLARQTVRDAIAVLADKGLVYTRRKAGTIVRHRTPVLIPLSRYGRVLSPGGTKGPWETATAAQGLDGSVELVDVRHETAEGAPSGVRDLGSEDVVRRTRHALIRPDDVVQIQHAWYARDLAESAGLAGRRKIDGGVYAALSAAGHVPATASETVSARMPTEQEAGRLGVGGKIPVLCIERLTKDSAGRPLEFLRVVTPADRVRLVYGNLPLAGTE